jgi:mono/diheme cytochrome c family protein
MSAPLARKLTTSALLVTVLLVAAAGNATEETRDARPFVAYGCYQCHGYSGHGASSGPRLSADMPYEGLQRIVRFPYGVMPAYPRELLSDEALRTIYSFIQSQPPARKLEELPLLNAQAQGNDR